MSQKQSCPCGKQLQYEKCCGRAHNNINEVKTAEELMRSRYTAFTMADINYLEKSWHSNTCPSKKELKETEKWAKSVVWLRLEIIKTNRGSENDDAGMVEFKAYYMENGMTKVIHEMSTFSKEKGHWVYVAGV